jgi:fructose-1,6-bisphosphatase/inositol monophosphatase family enzyme
MIDNNLTAFSIIKALFPTLKLAGDYACTVQNQVQPQPEKEEFGDNFYATALTDADLTIQNAIELALLAKFPHISFFGEEYQKSYNTKYFKSITFGAENDFLITLDPIDGTRAYLDGLPCFSIIFSIIKGRSYQAVFVLQPRKRHYFYALREKGAFIGNINDEIEEAKPLSLQPLNSNKVYLSFALADLKTSFEEDFETWCSAIDYSPNQNIPGCLDLIQGNLASVVIGQGNLIDSAAFAFIAKEAGAIVTTLDGENFEPFKNVKNMRIAGLIIAHNQQIHDKINILLSS